MSFEVHALAKYKLKDRASFVIFHYMERERVGTFSFFFHSFV